MPSLANTFGALLCASASALYAAEALDKWNRSFESCRCVAIAAPLVAIGAVSCVCSRLARDAGDIVRYAFLLVAIGNAFAALQAGEGGRAGADPDGILSGLAVGAGIFLLNALALRDGLRAWSPLTAIVGIVCAVLHAAIHSDVNKAIRDVHPEARRALALPWLFPAVCALWYGALAPGFFFGGSRVAVVGEKTERHRQ